MIVGVVRVCAGVRGRLSGATSNENTPWHRAQNQRPNCPHPCKSSGKSAAYAMDGVARRPDQTSTARQFPNPSKTKTAKLQSGMTAVRTNKLPPLGPSGAKSSTGCVRCLVPYRTDNRSLPAATNRRLTWFIACAFADPPAFVCRYLDTGNSLRSIYVRVNTCLHRIASAGLPHLGNLSAKETGTFPDEPQSLRRPPHVHMTSEPRHFLTQRTDNPPSQNQSPKTWPSRDHLFLNSHRHAPPQGSRPPETQLLRRSTNFPSSAGENPWPSSPSPSPLPSPSPSSSSSSSSPPSSSPSSS